MKRKFYKNKKVLITGHTGFKGSWFCRILLNLGANVTGYSLQPLTQPDLFSLADVESKMRSVIGDICDLQQLQRVFAEAQPEIVFHLAAQPIVRESYKDPRYTYETNVMGTVNVLECVRQTPSVKSFLNVTTDKVYLNRERAEGYREDEPLDGFDPYSNSKSCSELVTHCYKKSIFADGKTAISTARAGNVIGGGDFAKDRIIPDCVRAMQAGETIKVRNPHSIRPYQHVLEPLAVYLMIAAWQFDKGCYAGYYNVGPDNCDCITTGELAELFCKHWGSEARWESKEEFNAPHEANFLKLDCSLLKKTFGWQPRWHIEEAIQKTCAFSKVWLQGGNIPAEMDKEIDEFFGET
ncbi:MAG: CDP-glucose 4,6-dehydratase [Acidaminococcaceae bacterium]|nr:CDP-glucose 4,6-dehydratase [Acidaminococcaceae bacterium]